MTVTLRSIPSRKSAAPPLVGDANAFIRNPRRDFILAVVQERPGFVHHQIADELVRYRAHQEAARTALAANPSARCQVPMSAKMVEEARKGIRELLARYDALSALEPVDHESMRLEFRERAWVDPSAALLWGHGAWVGAVVDRENRRREKLRLAIELGHALPGVVPPALRPGDRLNLHQVSGLPDLMAELRDALAVAPTPPAKEKK